MLHGNTPLDLPTSATSQLTRQDASGRHTRTGFSAGKAKEKLRKDTLHLSNSNRGTRAQVWQLCSPAFYHKISQKSLLFLLQVFPPYKQGLLALEISW